MRTSVFDIPVETRRTWVTCPECSKEYQLVLTDVPALLDTIADQISNDPALTVCRACAQDAEIRLDRCPETVSVDEGVFGCALSRHHDGACTDKER